MSARATIFCIDCKEQSIAVLSDKNIPEFAVINKMFVINYFICDLDFIFALCSKELRIGIGLNHLSYEFIIGNWKCAWAELIAI